MWDDQLGALFTPQEARDYLAFAGGEAEGIAARNVVRRLEALADADLAVPTCLDCGVVVGEAHTGECVQTGGVEVHQTYLGGLDPETNTLVPRILPSSGSPEPALTPEEEKAISACISVAARIGMSYETYGGIEVGVSVDVANKALERLGRERGSDPAQL